GWKRPAVWGFWRVHEGTGVWWGGLDNGVRVHFKRVASQPGRVTVVAALAGGVINETAQNRGVTEAASLALLKPQTPEMPAAAFEEFFKTHGVARSAGRGAGGVGRGARAAR